jgi:curved DNA-binding protein CbpA
MADILSDPYIVLGVPKDANLSQVRSAHRKLVLKCHPEKIQDPALKAAKAEEFQIVQMAYELLSDDVKRSQYDEQVRLRELRAEMETTRDPVVRSSPFQYEIRTAVPRYNKRAYDEPRPAHREPGSPRDNDRRRKLFEEEKKATMKLEETARRKRQKKLRDQEERDRRRRDNEKKPARSIYVEGDDSEDDRRITRSEKVRSIIVGPEIERNRTKPFL